MLHEGSGHDADQMSATMDRLSAPTGSGIPDPLSGKLNPVSGKLKSTSLQTPLKLRGRAPDDESEGSQLPRDEIGRHHNRSIPIHSIRAPLVTLPPLLQSKKKAKGGIKIASINMRGGGSPSSKHKWQDINGLMRENNIAVLSAQETHLNPDRLTRIAEQFEKQILISNSHNPRTLNGKGVSIILNKRYTLWQRASFTDLIPGRALMLNLPWGERGDLVFLAVYAPKDGGENA
ncbi:hypothetical protein M422DRAFT_249350 [Sphaerobolus stellatus SS14]|uniref:Endonuclease/exonuclease/phosphatase domain-containing protein n=1 Tax=Sphaerobolus stellatus (strain SS14) TaxID=990650 RepID=A0A0C9W5I4_SPHS4|nr:hypothetical protein M422DRAFT_249350 [Sphaerobolus stellatus SS14]